jgi:hypothetical protein
MRRLINGALNERTARRIESLERQPGRKTGTVRQRAKPQKGRGLRKEQATFAQGKSLKVKACKCSLP